MELDKEEGNDCWVLSGLPIDNTGRKKEYCLYEWIPYSKPFEAVFHKC